MTLPYWRIARISFGGGKEASSIFVVGVETENGLGMLADRCPIGNRDRALSSVQELVDLALSALARHVVSGEQATLLGLRTVRW
jgi:hypothetical protein